MKKYISLIFLFVLSGLHAQVTILDEPLLGSSSFNTFTAISVSGTQSWYHHDVYGAVCSGYAAGQSYDNEDWLVSAEMNLTQTDNVKLTFNHTRGNAAVVNVGVAEGWYKVFATPNFTGDPTTTEWVELTGLNQNVTTAWQYVPSGELIIPDNVKSATSRIAFRYISSSSQSATWELKNVKVVGEPQSTNPSAGIFKITNWNVEWLGCSTFGPTDETLQINNVVSVMQSINSDVYCLQEVTNPAATIATLVSLMGSDNWGGAIVPSGSDNCDQRQGIIYKKTRVQFVSSTQLSSGSDGQGNSYYYNWSSGRYPSVYNVNLIAGGNIVPISFVNIHAKAEDGDAMSYARRLGGSEGLKTVLDGAGYNTKNLMLIGDFNDYLIGTSSSACSCTDSPYKNFMDDTLNYTAVTQSLTGAWNVSNPAIEHFIVSDELVGNYVSDSAFLDGNTAASIPFFYATTSHHWPETATFQFPVLGNPDFNYAAGGLKIYPNPVKNELRFDSTNIEIETTAIYDLTGRKMRCEKTNQNTFDVSALPVGVYVLKAGNASRKFVKN